MKLFQFWITAKDHSRNVVGVKGLATWLLMIADYGYDSRKRTNVMCSECGWEVEHPDCDNCGLPYAECDCGQYAPEDACDDEEQTPCL